MLEVMHRIPEHLDVHVGGATRGRRSRRICPHHLIRGQRIYISLARRPRVRAGLPSLDVAALRVPPCWISPIRGPLLFPHPVSDADQKQRGGVIAERQVDVREEAVERDGHPVQMGLWGGLGFTWERGKRVQRITTQHFIRMRTYREFLHIFILHVDQS